MTAKRAPEPLQGVEWVVICSRTYWGRCSMTHPAGPVGDPAGPLPGHASALPASGPIRARFHLISYKVSQKGIVSPKSVHKACHSPYFQNGVGKSPLQILRFPLLPAFSHKELMTHFRPYLRVLCQNDEVSPDVHTTGHAKSALRYPHGHARQARYCDRSSSELSAVFSLNADLLGN